MFDVALGGDDPPAAVALVPGAIEVLGDGPELNDEVAGEVLGGSLAALLAPEPDEGRLIAAHDDPGVRTADKRAAILVNSSFRTRVGHCVLRRFSYVGPYREPLPINDPKGIIAHDP